MKSTRKERLHEAVRREIKDIAWQQIAGQGAASLSLRAIARQMELTAPALYRYFPDRDALVTALIVDAYASLAESLSAASQSLPHTEFGARWAAAGHAYRLWALTYPQRYTLIFGTPISGYNAPLEVTMPAAASALGVLRDILHEAWNAGAVHFPPLLSEKLAGMHPQFQSWRELQSLDAPDEILYLTVLSWSRVHGLVSLELYHAYPPSLTDTETIFNLEVHSLLAEFGLGG